LKDLLRAFDIKLIELFLESYISKRVRNNQYIIVFLRYKKRNAYRLLVGNPRGKEAARKPRRRWVDNIRMDLVEVGWGDVDWIGLAQDRNRWRALVNQALNPRV
jgi:hypothetical protein